MRENLYIFETCGARMSDNEQRQQREKIANIDLKEKKILIAN